MRQCTDGDAKRQRYQPSSRRSQGRIAQKHDKNERHERKQRISAEFPAMSKELPPDRRQNARESGPREWEKTMCIEHDQCSKEGAGQDGDQADVEDRNVQLVHGPTNRVPNRWNRFSARYPPNEADRTPLNDDAGRRHFVLPE